MTEGAPPEEFARRTTPTLRLGATGPTAVAETALQEAVDDILSAISEAAGPARLVVVTCMAAGTDQLVATRARQRPATVWGIVPGRVDSYAARMTAEARSRFETLRAASETVLELDMPLPPGAEEEHRALRQRAYEEANLVMLEHTDILIAALSPDDQHKSGGAGETVAHAFALSIPVVLIDLSGSPFEWSLFEAVDPVVFRHVLRASHAGKLLRSLTEVCPPAPVGRVIKRILYPDDHGA